MKIIFIIILLMSVLISGYVYFKNCRNIHLKESKVGKQAASFLILSVVTASVLWTWLPFIIATTFVIGVIIYWVELSREEGSQIFKGYDGVIRDYEIPIKWINGCSSVNSNILFNPEDDRIDSVREVFSRYSSKYVYYAQMKNGKTKLIAKGSMTHKKINEKFNLK